MGLQVLLDHMPHAIHTHNRKQEDFDKAVQEAKDVIPDSIPGEDKLILYALFKQATVGDINTDRPGIFDQKGACCVCATNNNMPP